MELKLKNVYNKNSKFINLKQNFYVLAYNRAKIDKQCEHCTKLEKNYYFHHMHFCAQLVMKAK